MPTDLQRIQGTWKLTALETDGEAAPPASFGDARFIVAGNTFVSLGMGAPYEGTLELRADKSPKHFDLTFTAGPEQGNRNFGIYKLGPKKLTICLATRGNVRPGEFATATGSGLALETFEREPAKSPRSARKPAKTAAASSRRVSGAGKVPAGESTPIEGEWAMVSAVLDGKPLDAGMVKWCKRVTRGNVTKVLAGPQTMLDASFTLDAAAPGQIDYVNLSGSHKGKAQQGIYRLSGHELEICVALPGKPRPKDFASVKGDGRSYTVWRLLSK